MYDMNVYILICLYNTIILFIFINSNIMSLAQTPDKSQHNN